VRDLEAYDQVNFGFIRFEVGKDSMTGTYFSAAFQAGATPAANVGDRFTIDLRTRSVVTS
jgi:hypothetical protein